MNDPQPISTAPVRVVVLTNLGVAELWPDGDWVMCETDGGWVYDGYEELLVILPTSWTPLPDWMKP
jgi:hypothetical protein